MTSSTITFRSYDPKDKSRIIEIFYSNCPKYFDPNDEADLIDFLDNYADDNYLVVNRNHQLIGCGGHFTKEQTHGIAWTMFERNALGTKDLKSVADRFYREIEGRILAEGKNYNILVNTTQLMEKLFNSYGYETYEIIENGFGHNLHEYKMRKPLSKPE